MGYTNAIKSGCRACEGLFAKAPLRHTIPEGFVKAAKAGEVKICPNFLEGAIGDVASFVKADAKTIATDIGRIGIETTPATFFKSQQEIINYFKGIGIDIELRDISPKYLETFDLIKKEIEQLKEMGVGNIPKKIVLSDWSNENKTMQILEELGVREIIPKFPPDRRAYCGIGTDCLFINSSTKTNPPNPGVFKKFRHEVGHRNHYVTRGITDGRKSVLGQDIETPTEFTNRQLNILGIDDIAINIPNTASANFANGLKCNGMQIIPVKKQKAIIIDTTKLVETMNEACNCYNKTSLSEQIAEIFEDLLKGKPFEDRVLLIYDFCGGPRIPNLKIGGLKYDDYIKSLYKNERLLQQLKELISITPFST